MLSQRYDAFPWLPKLLDAARRWFLSSPSLAKTTIAFLLLLFVETNQRYLSDTGSKPFVCRQCRRPFARQDALTRHEKLHKRDADATQDPSTPSLPTPSTFLDLSKTWKTNAACITCSPSENLTESGSISEQQAAKELNLRNTPSDVDFDLIWPDSEELFQSIMATDVSDQWQMLSGTLPFPLVAHDTPGPLFRSPVSFDDRGSSVGDIPNGSGHRAVHDVTELVASSVSGSLNVTFFLRFHEETNPSSPSPLVSRQL